MSISQIGCVVHSIAEAEKMYAGMLGVPAWTRFPDVSFAPDRTTYRGAPADFAIDVSLGYAGDLQVELIQPVRGTNIYTEFLERSGPGVHHLGTVPVDYDAAVADARGSGLEVVMQGRTDEIDFTYFDTPGTGAHFVELMRLSPRIGNLFDSMRAAAAAR